MTGDSITDGVGPVGCVGLDRVVVGTISGMKPTIEGNGPGPLLGENVAGDAFGPEPRQVEVEDHFRRGVIDRLEYAVFLEQAHTLQDLVIEAIVQTRCPSAGELCHQLIEVLTQETWRRPRRSRRAPAS